MSRENRSLQIRAFNCICSLVLIISLVYILVMGLEKLAATLIAVSVISLAAPVVVGAEGILEIAVGIVEALIEGIMLIIEGIVTALLGIFS